MSSCFRKLLAGRGGHGLLEVPGARKGHSPQHEPASVFALRLPAPFCLLL